MKIKIIDSPASGIWARDCELISLINDKTSGFILKYHKESNDTYWNLISEIRPAYKVVGEEFFRVGYLRNLPREGSFFEVLDSPWIKELGEFGNRMPVDCKHYVLQFYDETVEIIASKFIFEPLKGECSVFS